MRWIAVCLAAGCWTSSPKQAAPPSNAATDPAVTAKAPAGGQAKVIQRTQSGGVIELDGERGAAMERANLEMSKHCGSGNFVIVQEGEEAIGEDRIGGGTELKTAWRVHYQCAS